MILDIIVHKSDDGFTAEIPSLKGCESWAHDLDGVLQNIVELAAYYLNTDVAKFKVDKARESKTKIIYKLVFDKAES
jgi:predicted RNase H-like HicB family nuclease